METPENAKKISSSNTSSSSSESVAVQDSPVFDYISNLSPIKHVKAAPVAQGFQELNSPPLVLTSPQVNPHCQSSSFKRHHYPQSSCVEIYGEDDKGKTVITVADEFRKSNTQVSSELVPSTAKESDNKSSIQEQVGSSSRCVDAYFADIVNVDCADSTHSANLSLKQSHDAPQSPNALMESKEPVFKLEINNDIRKDVAMPTGASATALEQPEEDRQGKSSFDVKPVETDGKQGSGDIPSSPCPKVECLSVDKNLDKQRYEHSVTKNAGAGCKVDLKSTSQVLPESLQIVPEDEDCDKPSEAISSEHFEDMMLNDPKASQHRRGMHRRCLQFEEAQQKIIADSPGYWNPSNSVTISRSPASFVDSEVLESSFVDIPATPSNRQLTNMILSKNDENSSLKVSRPSGIGLHLNSIVTAMPMGFCATASTKSAYRGYFNVQATNEDSRQDSHDSIAASSATSSFTSSGKPLNNTLLLKSNEHQATPCDKKRSNFEHADGVELNQLSPKKKRKKTSGTSDGDGCKRCNCKKTKCLKLYCDCFAAGIYCAEPCACQGCFNRPEYEDTVLEVRQQRESRNPLAFAPKIIQHAAEPPAHTFGENENRLTSSSARHKRGCNCKKSMCLKKYCECYQANVGCSDGCRCEGCKNVYGRKEDYGISKDVVGKQTIEENLDCSFNEKLEMEATLKSSSHTEFCNPYHMTPMTPSFQYSYGKDASNSWFSGGGYLTTPESHLSLLESYGMSPGSPRNSDNHDMILETNKDILGFNSFDQELDYGYVEAVDESSPIFHGLGNAGHLAAPRNPPSMAMTSQTSPNTMERRNCSGNGRFQSVSSLRWRSSPITPMTRFGGTKILQVLDSDNRLSDIGDDTPEILKNTNTPLSAVKVTSPNKKRVSPPHPHLHALGSSSSTGLRSGRKFILQAVSSFPPLTPCVDPKDSSTSQNTNNPQH